VPIDLASLADPVGTAIVALELKRVTVGDLQASSPAGAPGNPLGEEAARLGLVPRLERLVHAGRSAGVPVVHATAAYRADGAGSPRNCPLLARAWHHRQRLLVGSPEAAPVPELDDPRDLHSVRLHGVGPFIGTDLDPTLRSLGARNLVLVGGSVNVGLVAACAEAVDLGYRVVIPRDGVVGVPAAYVELVFEHTLTLLARITTVDELVAVWDRPG
jgi:nicotinamidase-related amidase